MSLEEFTPVESSEWWDSAESSREVSETFKQSVKKASAGIKRTKKDERKAKKHDLLLANFLVKIILDKKYDFILNPLFKSLDAWYPSNFILWILSLINVEISDKIRTLSEKDKINFSYTPKQELTDFHDHDLDDNLKDRINFWVEDITDIISIEYSCVLTKNLISIIGEEKEVILDFTSLVFIFFFSEININISKSKSDNYCDFILSEIRKSLKGLSIDEI